MRAFEAVRETMEGRVVIECAIIGFFGLLSVVLGFASEATRIKVRKNYVGFVFSFMGSFI